MKTQLRKDKFSQYLSFLVDEKHISVGYLVSELGINQSTFNRWMNGRSLPKNIEIVKELAKILRCTLREGERLGKSYYEDRFGEYEYLCYQKILSSVTNLSTLPKPIAVSLEDEKIRLPMKSSQTVLHGKKEVLHSLRELWHGVGEQKIYMKIHSVSEVMEYLMEQELKNAEVKLFFGTEKKKILSEEIIKILNSTISLLGGLDNLEVYTFSEDAFDDFNMVATRDWVMIFEDEAEEALCVENQEWINFIQNYMLHLMEENKPLLTNYESTEERLSEYLKHTKQGYNICCLEYAPGLSIGLTNQLLEKHIYKDIPNRDQLLKMVDELFVSGSANIQNYISVFEKDGLERFMQKGMESFDSLIGKIASSLEMEEKCQILERVIAMVEEKEEFRYHMVKEGNFRLAKTYMELMLYENATSLKLIYFGDTCEKNIVVKMEEISEIFKNFFEWICQSEYVYSKEETLAIMKEVLNEYRK